MTGAGGEAPAGAAGGTSACAASAPGKLVLLGEYAVLDGAPAVVAAVDRRVHASVRATGAGPSRLLAPQIVTGALDFVLDEGRRLRWLAPPAEPARLALVAAVVEAFAAGLPPGLELRTDSAAFFDGAKLGLGSSAALTVALAAALSGGGERVAASQRWLRRLVELHRRFQSGRGSGIDIAASLYGGVLAYRGGEQPEVRRLCLPEELHLSCVWTGTAASTGAFLQRLAAWARREPAAHGAARRALASAATTAADLAGGGAGSWLEALAGYGDALRAFGEAAGLPIYGSGHAQLAAAARRAGVAYKPSGAGGGDIGVAASDDPRRLAAFGEGAAAAGARVLRLAVGESGVAYSTD